MSLLDLTLPSNSITSMGLVIFFLALQRCKNLRLQRLDLHGNNISVNELAKSDCLDFARALCDTTRIDDIYCSNHTFHDLVLDDMDQYPWYHDWREIHDLLELNKNPNKSEVARQKILKYYIVKHHADISVFLAMRETSLPFAIEWIGRDAHGFSAMYNFVRGLPTLFDVNNVS